MTVDDEDKVWLLTVVGGMLFGCGLMGVASINVPAAFVLAMMCLGIVMLTYARY